jgi:hypothetical protein
MLKRSKFEVACQLQGIDVLVPDDTNFEQSKFLLLQTGSIVVGTAVKGEPMESNFVNALVRSLAHLSETKHHGP